MDRLRTVYLTPYQSGMGPRFRLTTWDTGHEYRRGPQWCIGYRLEAKEPGGTYLTVFTGEDFGCSPLDAIESDACVKSILGFLTLRPGDTDRDYFDAYTPEQLAFAESHAEALSCAVGDRFGWD